MRYAEPWCLLAILWPVGASAQEIEATASTYAQLWKQDIPGMDPRNYLTAVQFIGIDALALGRDEVSMHLHGWGVGDLREHSLPRGKGAGGDLSYGYVQYRLGRANAEAKVGRLQVIQGGSVEVVDGASAGADLRGGFNIAAFAGRPVAYGDMEGRPREDYVYQRDLLFGVRVGKHLTRMAEVGLFYLQDGSQAAHHLVQPSVADYTRRHLGLDVRVTSGTQFALRGRTVCDVANHPVPAPGLEKPSRIAEHDYTLVVGLPAAFTFTGGYAQRHFRAYYAGTTLPSLFRQEERGRFQMASGRIGWDATDELHVSADYRHTQREVYGTSDRMGVDLRWSWNTLKRFAGISCYRVLADNVLVAGSPLASYGMSHREFRAWAMVERKQLSASLDAIYQAYDDSQNPHLHGTSNAYELVASVGYRPTKKVRVSGDLGVGANPLFRREVRGLIRVEYRFDVWSAP